MAKVKTIIKIIPVKKRTSQGTAGRSRRVKLSTKHLNKHKRTKKTYRGQGK